MRVCDNLHSNKKYKYIVFTEYDIILQEYYIIKRHKSMTTYIKRLKDAHELQKENLTSRSRNGKSGKDLMVVRLIFKESMVFHGGVHFGPNFGI